MPGFLGGSTGGTGTGGEISFPKEFIDPVTKLRVSQPENLIDTDFEYGLQPTKWETVELINNTPSFFSKSGDTTIPNIISITTNAGTREITVTTALEHGVSVGIPISVTGTKSITADGAYIINSIPNTTTFTYLCKANQPTTASIEDLYSSIITGEFFQGSQLRVADASGIVTDNEEGFSTLTITTDSAHGFKTNTPFYFLNLNSTISKDFQASNTAAKSFDSTNSAVAQTFDGSNTLSSINIDWSNSATVGGVISNISGVSTLNNTITVAHSTENFANQPLGTPLYYAVTGGSGYFATNPRGVIFLKTIDSLGTSTSTFQVSAVPDGDVIPITAAISGTFQLANQARTFAGNNSNSLTQTNLTVVKETEFAFDGGNRGYAGIETNGLCTVEGYSGTILVSTTSGAGLDYYVGAMVKYVTTGSAASGLVNNRTYFIASFTTTVTPNQYRITIKELPDSASALAPTGGSGDQTFQKIGVSTDKNIIHIKDSNYAVKDMIEYSSFPVGTGGRFAASSEQETKLFYFVAKAYDAHNYELNAQFNAFTVATGGTVSTFDRFGRTYKVHTFTTVGNSTFAVESAASSANLEYLIVAGGGSGGANLGGGGGAGGVLTNVGGTGLAITAQNYTITVGAGGASVSGGQDGAVPNNGGNSSAFGLTAIGGGGGGGGFPGRAAVTGGSGGGAGGYVGASGAAGTAGQGNAGGLGENANQYRAGGGGGAGGAGGNLNNSSGRGGFGGPGIVSNITGASVTYAGGGGGGSYVSNSGGGIGGTGGGGGGGTNSSSGGPGGTGGVNPGQAGTASNDGAGNSVPRGGNAGANTGSGGGGGGHQTAVSGAGGSGIVILRYPITPEVPFVPAVASGGTVATYTESGVTYRTHSFTSTGANTFTISNMGTVNEFDILMVGGGGAAGNYAGGGGGGEVVHVQKRALATTTYNLVVGAGGTGAVSSYTTSMNGQATTGFGETAKGGGGAKSSDDYDNPVGANGTYTAVANGGGGSSRSAGYFGTLGTTVGTSGTTVRYGGNRGGQVSSGGGSGNQSPNYPGGGGGGAGGSVNGDTGGTTSANASGNGGPGVSIQILQSAYVFGGGGGGGVYYNSPATTAGSGGIGGGGGGGNSSAGSGGTGGLNPGNAGSTSSPFNGGSGGANTGGGAGAGRGETGGRGGDGGSGIIVVRYPIAVV
jgi:hypothetical protein